MWFLYNGILSNRKGLCNHVIHCNLDGTEGCRVEQSHPEEGQILEILTFLWYTKVTEGIEYGQNLGPRLER